jgi:protein transport protein SEC23
MHSFILPLSAVETNIQSILEELQRDPKPVKNDRRPLRSTGAAISIAVSLMEVSSIIIIIEDPRGSCLHV